MDTQRILTELRAERDRLQKAIEAFEALDSSVTLSTSHPQANIRAQRAKQSAAKGTAKQISTGKRTMSAAARRKISEAAKKRWAERKGKESKSQASAKQVAARQTAAKQAAQGGLTPAGRKHLSDMMKKRWAERRKKAGKTA